MADQEVQEVTYSRGESYSRSSRRGNRKKQNKQELNREFQEQMVPTRYWLILLLSALTSLLTVANPLLSSLANNSQSQNIYAGLAMQAGQEPYESFFGTSGVLYYLLTYVGSFFNTTIGLALLQWIALGIAGIYFYKIMAYFSRSQATADNLLIWFYLFIFALDFGGLYASLFALPFLLTSIWFLIRYFENAVRDEVFILYGIDAAIVFMIYPKSALLWIVSSLVLLVYNIRNRHLARGIYQLLGTLFGFLLIVYSVGYYAFVSQILGLAVQQTFFYNISLSFSYSNILWTLLAVLGFLVLTGFFKNFLQTIVSLGDGRHGYIKAIILLTFVSQLIFIIGNENFELSQLTILFPYGFILAVLHLRPLVQENSDGEVQIRRGDLDYLKSSLYLPLVACVMIPMQSLWAYWDQGDIYQERLQVSQYIQENSDASDTIYAWDNSAQVYLKSGRLSAGRIITAAPYLNTETNQSSITYDLNKNKAAFIVVNQEIPLLDGVKSNLEANYTKVELQTEKLVLYKKK
ncbi:TPA: quinol oxidase [Streptococcus suis]